MHDRIEFEWDLYKNFSNIEKHGVSFEEARKAFLDPRRVIRSDIDHSADELRYFCLGLVDDNVLTVRFTLRERRIRIFGAGYWRQGRAAYEQANQIH